MKVYAIEIMCDTAEDAAELIEQLEQQCIQTVETGIARRPGCSHVVHVTPHITGQHILPELLVG